MKERRKELGISQNQLAEKTDLSPGMIASIEIGKVSPSIESLERITRALQLHPYQILLTEEDKKPFNQEQLRKSFEYILGEELNRMEATISERLRTYKNN